MTFSLPIHTRRFGDGRSHHEGLRWPGGAGLAVSFVLNIEEGAELSLSAGDERNEAVHEVRHEIRGVPDFCMETHFEYGPRAGYRRVVQRFADLGWPLTLNCCGRALEATPWVADDARRHGFEICAHGWRWESPAGMDEATERAQIARTVATIERLWGRPPVGWHSKSSRSVHTRSLQQEHGGFLYDSDDYGGDLPYCLPRADGGQHVVLPYAFDTNDMRFFDQPAFVRGADFAAYVGDAIDQLLVESEQAPRMLTIGLHTRIIGRPARIGGLDAVLARLRGLGQRVWIARREDIARHWLALTG
ncbi:polysaccharide deacetylase family protein [Ramlibacter sp. 2FC]|uniref:polysaccharide deacetylase family protein n=1 Tax=Ramlibacter sp. 2FC TaxID=2502188 RepID=UPI0010FA23EA|nr:polysaccharide deacetylase family protein [Ramlibacter sp. 2FC]